MANSNTQVAFDTNGTLGRVWLAAHWDKRLTKGSISSHDIPDSVLMIKSPGNVYSLRISGFLLLGLCKIYSKKSIISLEEAEQAVNALTQTPVSTNPEVLREIGLTDVPEKLKLAPVKRPELFNPIIKTQKIEKKVEKVKTVVVEPQAEEADILGVTTSFLDDVEMAEQWLKKDEEVAVELPSKRPREKVWQNFINTNFSEDIVLPDPPERTEQTDQVTSLDQSIQVPRTDPAESKPFIKQETEESKTESKNESKAETKVKKPRPRHVKQIVKDLQSDLIIDPEVNMGLDCTSDIVKNTRLYQPVTEVLPQDIEQIFYVSVIKEIASELENFYISHVKIQRLKNCFREEEEKEPVILSNSAAQPQEIFVEPEPCHIVEPVPEPAKVEKVEEKNDETWSSRTLKLLKLLKIRLSGQKTLLFDDLSKKMDRRVMACGFYEVLQLCLKDFIVLETRDSKILLSSTERLMRLNIM